MAYTVRMSAAAETALSKLPNDVRQRIIPRIGALADNPRPHGVKKMRGEENAWRIRVGDYRVVYEIHDKVLLVLIVKVGHRRDVYE